MFTKIKQDFLKTEFNDWMSLKGNELKSSYETGDVVLEYFNILDIDFFKKIHLRNPFSIKPDRVRFSRLTGTGMLNPHVDHSTSVALNFYIDAGEDLTIFYKQNNNAAPFSYSGKNQSNIYNVVDLTEESNFIAKSGEAYLLDVSQIHSVNKVNPNPRLFISYLWDTAMYEEVLKDFKGRE
jgi:hypothetical protein